MAQQAECWQLPVSNALETQPAYGNDRKSCSPHQIGLRRPQCCAEALVSWQKRGQARVGLGPRRRCKEGCVATDCVSSSILFEGQRPRGGRHQTLEISSLLLLSWRDAPTFHRDIRCQMTKISNQNNTSQAAIWASAAGRCIGVAVGMAQQAECWQFPVSPRHRQHGQNGEMMEGAAPSASPRQWRAGL